MKNSTHGTLEDSIVGLTQLLELVQTTYQHLYGEMRWRCHAQIKQIIRKGRRAYIELVELGENGAIRAQTKGIVRDDEIITDLIKKVGMSSYEELLDKDVVMSTSVHFHPVWGFSLYIHDFSAEHIVGKEQLRLQMLMDTLKREGVWGANKQCVLGDPPRNLAVITAPDSAGWQDFETILHQSLWKWHYSVFPAIVHGPSAVSSILDAREKVERTQRSLGEQVIQYATHPQKPSAEIPKPYDALLILRGGGAKEGMVWSQDEAIVRRACTTKIPVMSALGHTQDMTILDQVVWRSFATPSDAAHALCGMVRDHETQIKTVMQLIQGLIHQRMQSTRNTVERRFQATQMLTKHRITTYRNNVDLRYTMIQAVGPEKILDKGFNVMRDPQTFKPLTTKQQDQLMPGDRVMIHTKHRLLQATITSVSEHTENQPYTTAKSDVATPISTTQVLAQQESGMGVQGIANTSHDEFGGFDNEAITH